MKKWGVFLGIVLLACGICRGQVSDNASRIVFYNVENLFDTRNDSLTLDDDFTPRGRLYWNRTRYNRKLLHLAQALLAAGEKSLPAFIGLAEVENRYVLEDLTRKTALADGDYAIVHADSPDRRGIDVALLYRKSVFRLLDTAFLRVSLAKESPTRDILYCKGVFNGERDTLHFFVAHFPSMRGGEVESEWKRVRAGKVLRMKVDSIFACNRHAAIIIMGDLNGKANTVAQKKMKIRSSDARVIKNGDLYNTGYYLLKKNYGSYNYRGVWSTIDHIIVSGALLNGSSSLQVSRHLTVCRAEFLLQENKKQMGWRPYPTYRGPRYLGGYSDHLPVFIDLKQ